MSLNLSKQENTAPPPSTSTQGEKFRIPESQPTKAAVAPPDSHDADIDDLPLPSGDSKKKKNNSEAEQHRNQKEEEHFRIDDFEELHVWRKEKITVAPGVRAPKLPRGQLPGTDCLHHLSMLWYRERRTECKTKNKASRYTALRLINPDVMLSVMEFIGDAIIAYYKCYDSDRGTKDSRGFFLIRTVGSDPMQDALRIAFQSNHANPTQNQFPVRNAKWIGERRLRWQVPTAQSRGAQWTWVPVQGEILFEKDFKRYHARFTRECFTVPICGMIDGGMPIGKHSCEMNLTGSENRKGSSCTAS